METVGTRIRRLRLSKGLSQTDLSSSAVSASYVSLVETGKRTPGPEVLAHLAGVLETTTYFLQTGEDEVNQSTVQAQLDFAALALAQGDWQEALSQLERIDTSAVTDEVSDPVMLALARAHEGSGDLESAVALLEPLIVKAEASGRVVLLLEAVTAAAGCYLEAADITRAVEVAESALVVASRSGLEGTDEYVRLAATLVWALYERGDLLYAQQRVAALIDQTESIGSRRARGSLYWNAALVAEGRGRLADARALTQRALALFAEEDAERDLARLRLHHGWLLLREAVPEPEQALAELQLAESRLRKVGSVIDVAYCEVERARALNLLGRPEEAESLVRQALEPLERDPRLETCHALLVLADAQDAQGHHQTARATARRAAQMLGLMKATRQSAAAWRELGDRLRRHGDVDGAMTAYDEAMFQLGLVGANHRPSRPAVTSPQT